MRRSYSFKLRISRTVGLAQAVASRARTRRIAAVWRSLRKKMSWIAIWKVSLALLTSSCAIWTTADAVHV